jgi:predicted oxidoreductase
MAMSGNAPDVGPSRLIYGIMGLGGSWDSTPYTDDDVQAAEHAIDAALELGITWFDAADVYRCGKSESVLGEVLAARPELRQRIKIQTKCGIRFPGNNIGGDLTYYREDGEVVLSSLESSLKRLQLDRVECLLLHRPSPLIDRPGTARALDRLVDEGTVGAIGVSNMSHHRIEALQAHLSHPLVVDQLQLSLGHRDFVEVDLAANDRSRQVAFPEGTLEYVQAKGIQLQAWGPLDSGIYGPEYAGTTPPRGMTVAEAASPDVANTRAEVARQAAAAGVAPTAILLAWLIRHPAGIVPVIGSSNPARIAQAKGAAEVAAKMSQEDWWRLFSLARGAQVD